LRRERKKGAGTTILANVHRSRKARLGGSTTLPRPHDAVKREVRTSRVIHTWEGSTTVVYTFTLSFGVIPVVWWGGGNTALWLAEEEPIAWKFKLGTYKKTHFLTNHSAVFPPSRQTTGFRQTTV